jgi:hypothetical protein
VTKATGAEARRSDRPAYSPRRGKTRRPFGRLVYSPHRTLDLGRGSGFGTVDLCGHLDLADVARDLALVEARTGINPGAVTL